jgi:ABC-type uncharacterized transport system substrate-binding protein
MTALLRISLIALTMLAFAAPARAHPHVWVTMHTELVYAPDGSITGVRHHWAFDDMFSAFATQGMEAKEKGKFTREELAPLAKVNVESLKEYDYFTYATADGKKAELTEPAPDYWLDFNDSILTLISRCRSRRQSRPRSSRSRSTTRPFSSTSNGPRKSRCISSARRIARPTW